MVIDSYPFGIWRAGDIHKQSTACQPERLFEAGCGRSGFWIQITAATGICHSATDRYPSSNGYSAGKIPTRAPSGCYPLKRPALREPEESFAIGYGYDRSAAIAAILTGYRVHRWGDEAVIGALEVNRLQ